MTVPAVSLLPYSAIAATIASRLAEGRGSDSLAPWPEDVIVASSGMAHSISRALLDRIPSGVAGLQLQSIEVLARQIVNAAGEYPRIATDLERRLAMRTAARMVDDPLTGSRGAAAMLERSYRDVRDSGLTLTEFSQRVRRAKGLRNGDRIRLLLRVWQSYERLIEKLGATDAADVLARAASLAGSAALPPQIVAGFYDMTGAQLGLLNALAAAGKLAAVYIPVDRAQPDAYRFAQPFMDRFNCHFEPEDLPLGSRDALAQGRLRGEARREIPPSGDEHPPAPLELTNRWTVRQEPTREAEIRAVCTSVRNLLDSGKPPESIGIVVRALDGYDAQLLHRFARQSGFAPTAAQSSSLAAHPFGRALVLLLRIRDRNFPRGEVLEIARSGVRLRARLRADEADRDTRQRQIAGGTSAALRERRIESLVIGDYIEAVAELEELTEKFTVRSIQEIVDRFRPASRADLDALETLQQTVDVFRRAETWKRPFDPSAFIDAVEAARIERRTAGNDVPAIWAGDVMTFRGRSFEHLFAIRMQDDVLPQRRVEDPLLVDGDRRLLGIREIGDGRSEEQLLFRLICDGAGTTHFSLAASDGFGKPLRPSQLLKQFAIEQVPSQRASILKNRLTGLPAIDGGLAAAKKAEIPGAARRRPLQLLARAGRRGEFDGYLHSSAVLARAAEKLQSISPTQLEDFGECPQKFFLKHILDVKDLEDPEMEMQLNARDKGTVNHSILETFYLRTTPEEIFEAARSLPLLPVKIVECLDRAVDEVFDRLQSEIPAFNPAMRSIERRATRRVLRHFIAGDIADLAGRGLAPKHFEYRFGSTRRRRANEKAPDRDEPFVVDVRGIPLKVEGMIDRIDVTAGPPTPSSVLRIVDYKSGKAARHKNLGGKIDRGVRLQLALYAMAASEFFGTAAERISGAIKPLAGGVKASDYEFELAGKSARLRETLDIFVAAILRGDFPAFPNDSDRENDFNSCKYCPVNHSCRTLHDADESRAVLRAGEPRTLLAEDRH